MKNGQMFGALRATTIAALCAGAGLSLAGCDAGVETKQTFPLTKPADAKAGATNAVPDATPAADAKKDAEKPGGESKCGGDKKCGQGKCGAGK